MPTRSQIAASKRKLIQSIQSKLDRTIKKSESALYREILLLIAALHTKGNDIDNSAYNLRILTKLRPLLDKFSKGRGQEMIDLIINDTGKVMDVNELYFKKVDPEIPKSVPKRVRKKVFLGLGYDDDKNEILDGGLIDNLKNETGLGKKLLRLGTGAVLGKITLPLLKKTFRRFIIGDDKRDGALTKELKPQVGNIYSGIDRTTGTQYSTEMGLNFALWNNSPKATTTDFCRKRAGNLYSRKEIEAWNNLPDWPGRIDGARVEDVGHGYNCRTSIDWISDELAEVLINGGKELDIFN